VQLAGSVTARKNQRATTSDWMELEKKRGISISSTVLQFEYDGYRINLLDTPGHKDFSEDTYRVLTAVDAAVMVIDAAKGIESQTRKLFEVCRQRGVPIFTFMNKCDRPMRDPLALLDELERVLGIGAYPVNWPLGNGPDFRGVYDRRETGAFLRARGAAPIARPFRGGCMIRKSCATSSDEATFTDRGGTRRCSRAPGRRSTTRPCSPAKLTPVFFGSAINNFGVQLLLDGFLEHAPRPAPAREWRGIEIAPETRVLRFHLQDSGEHGPEAPRPHRVRARLLRQVRARHDRPSHAHRPRRRCACPVRTSFSATNARRWTRPFPATSSAWSARSLRHRRHAHDGSLNPLQGNPALHARKHSAYLHNPNTGQVQAIPPGLDQLLQEGVIQALYLRNSR
jgi:peptide chain release factor 3